MSTPDEARSRDIAAYVGPLLTALAAGMLLNRNALPDLARQIGNDYGLIFLSGALLLVAGIAIVRAHNVWHGGWRVLVTVSGWLAIVGGLIRILFFRQLAELSGSVATMPNVVAGAALVMLLIGIFLSLKGYTG